MFDVFFGLYNPFPPLDPKRPLHMLYMFLVTYHCPKGILGLGGESILKQTERHQFHLSMTSVKILIKYSTHEQNEYHNVLEMKITFNLNILTLILFENLMYLL